jgi:hypothetical protein
MQQSTFEKSGAGASQCDKILAVLQGSPNKWIPMPRLARASGAYAVHSRISDLRARGWHIEQKSDRSKGPIKVRSSYRLCV